MYYLVSYDLRNPGNDYQNLINALKEFADWWHCLNSVWIVPYTGSAISLAKYLRQFMDSNDQLLVLEIARDWSSVNLSDECPEWLRVRLAGSKFS